MAAEERINEMQVLVDQTFQQFALDDSEEEGDEDSLSGGSNLDLLAENGLEPSPSVGHNINSSSQ